MDMYLLNLNTFIYVARVINYLKVSLLKVTFNPSSPSWYVSGTSMIAPSLMDMCLLNSNIYVTCVSRGINYLKASLVKVKFNSVSQPSFVNGTSIIFPSLTYMYLMNPNTYMSVV